METPPKTGDVRQMMKSSVGSLWNDFDDKNGRRSAARLATSLELLYKEKFYKFFKCHAQHPILIHYQSDAKGILAKHIFGTAASESSFPVTRGGNQLA